MSQPKQVVIVGGSYAAISALKTIAASTKTQLSITVVAPSTKSFFNVAAPRLLVDPSLIPQTLFSLEETIQKSTELTIHESRFIHASADSLDLDQNELTIKTSDGKKEILRYDYLVIASGARSISPAWKLNHEKDYQYAVDEIEKLSSAIKDASSIAIVGGGPTGVETAGELATAYKNKHITLYTGSPAPLSAQLPNHSKSTIAKLEKLGVEIINDQRVTRTSTGVSYDGKSKDYDVVLEAQQLYPNTEFVPAAHLDSSKFLITDEHLRVPKHHNVLALGDVLSLGARSIVDLSYVQKPVFEKTVAREIGGDQRVQLKKYQRAGSVTILVPLGPSGGVGSISGWSVPSFLVWLTKARDYMIPRAKNLLE
ncbi:uncharacterized protein LODBEIA_P36480 [Lodderomyces beijingensis]|uniref:FAD/NAD(P)-binding domain-containing protein n=1 Tax=Lodderomyces beijingensis TaxID=1775926 RepID=A0ABP0ZND7_9ASCO